MLKLSLLTASVLLFLPNLFNIDINPTLPYDHKEKFDSHLSYINSIDKLEEHVDSIAMEGSIAPGSLDYVITIESAIKNRFYHGFSHFTLSENWIAAVSGKIISDGLACKVQPEGIMNQDNAACSQQALVMMALLRKKNISYRSIGFPHHYALEVLIHENWYYFDPNMEPNINTTGRLDDNWKCSADNLKQYYDTARYNDLDYKFGSNLQPKEGVINEIPAPRARLFQATAGILSKALWCFPLILIFYRPKISFSSSRKKGPATLPV